MSVVALPDLNALPADALRALILTQYEQLVSAESKLLSTESKLTTTQEQLQSREREIEHLKLLLAKLHRMQFGRKSEKLTRQIEQLELSLPNTNFSPYVLNTWPDWPTRRMKK